MYSSVSRLAASAVALRKESVDRNDVVLKNKHALEVALRKESVDRNTAQRPSFAATWQSLSARRAWIEIWDAQGRTLPAGVALRKESVDRNFAPSQADILT